MLDEIGRYQMDEKVYLLVSPEVARMLDDHEADLAELLKREGLKIERESDPTTPPESTKKDAVLVVLATAGAVATITPLVQTVLDKILRRPILIEENVMDVLKDDAGNPLMDASGNPRTYWRKGHKLVEPKPAEPGSTETSIGWGKIGITIKSQTGSRAAG